MRKFSPAFLSVFWSGLGLWAVCLAAAPGLAQTPTLTTLHSFSGDAAGDGERPFAALTPGDDGNFYGATDSTTPSFVSGVIVGTVFRVTPAGELTTLHAFSGDSGNGTVLSRVQRDHAGNLYGTLANGGTNGQGAAYKLTPDGSVSTLYSFGPLDQTSTPPGRNVGGGSPTDGILPGADGNFYGTTGFGGANGAGTVFRFNAAGQLSTLHDFSTAEFVSSGLVYSADGTRPGNLMQASDGSFYGACLSGGRDGYGTIFHLTQAGVYTVLHNFDAAPTSGFSAFNRDGIDANPLVQGPDGNFYGTAASGGSHAAGTLFRLTPTGALTVLHVFGASNAGTDGSGPGALVLGRDGNLYGTTANGGAEGMGTVFRATLAGEVTILASFSSAEGGGTHPYRGLTAGPDGSFYGTTYAGGASDLGTVFRFTPPPLPTVTLSIITPTIMAGSGQTGSFSLSIPEAQAADVRVHYQVAGGAVAGTDYQALKGTAKIKAGATTRVVRIVPLGNLGGAGKRTVKLTLTADDGYTVGNTGSLKVKILAPMR